MSFVEPIRRKPGSKSKRSRASSKRNCPASKNTFCADIAGYTFSTDSLRNDLKSSKMTEGMEIVPVWYWSNYYKALEWHNKHKAALWKSYALAVQEENKYLLQELLKLNPNRSFNGPLSSRKLEVANESSYNRNNEMDCDKLRDYNEETSVHMSSNSDEEIEFEMSEEMIKFFETSFRHKLEMKKLNEEKNKEVFDSSVRELQEAHQQREKEMKLLYGDGSSMIIGMETAVQLSFDKYCDMKSPKYWPNIPFNL